MHSSARRGVFVYAAADYLAAWWAWCVFFIYRKNQIEASYQGFRALWEDTQFWLGILLLPLGWLMYYLLSDTYGSLLKKSRLSEIGRTALQTLTGGLLLFFTLMLNDWIRAYSDYYRLFFVFIALHFSLTVLLRLAILTYYKQLIAKGRLFIPVLYVGTPGNLDKIESENKRSGVRLPYRIVAQVVREETTDWPSPEALPVTELNYEEVIIAMGNVPAGTIEQYVIHFLQKDKTVQMLPDELDIVSGKFKTESIFGSPLQEIPVNWMTPWQKLSKRAVDMAVSLLGLILLSPLFLLLAMKVKSSSKGPVFFTQKRVGYNGKEFDIIKFRSMREDAEQGIPQLSSEHDARITPFGRIMRKYRLDELPQLWNVLKGEMSLVGPRPERRYFIDQIIHTAPQYQLLQRVKPGITSLGMVKYGYASNLQEMLQRMRYDLLYIENMSMLMDVKILLYTVITLWKGAGK